MNPTNKIPSIIFLVLVIGGGFLYRDKIKHIWQQSFSSFFPCKAVITYDLGQFDTKFGVSKVDFLKSVSDAEKIWESAIGKDLFKYEEGGRLKINLVYDTRQETTQKLKSTGIAVENTKASYDSLKIKYSNLSSEYESLKNSFESRLNDFQKRKSTYDAEVSQVNSRGGANKATYNRLNAERDYLNKEVSIINQLQGSLNQKIDEINTLAETLNNLAKTLNITVDRFNTIGATLGGEFEEGTYTSSGSGQAINIFQFDSRTKLVRVLAHEFGHALGLEHNEDSKAIMYRLNNGINEKLTTTDIKELKALCGIK
ncbi:MAG TPA: matrixin family metalloprotease [Candidatus Paceibacterota bacterium]